MRKSNGAAWLAAAISLASSRLDAAASIPFVRGAGDAIVVPVAIDGREPVPFLLDTGTALTRVEASLARELGLRSLGVLDVVTMAGRRQVERSRVSRLTLGPHHLEAVDVLTGANVALPEVGVRIRGVLGQSALARIRYGIDYRGRRLLFDVPSGTRVARVPLQWREGRPAAMVRDPHAGALLLVFDTGLDRPVLFEKAGRPLPFREVQGMRFAAATTTGRADLRAVSVPSLEMGSLRLAPLEAAVVPDADAGRRDEDGLLPTRLFASVFFDREANQVLIEPR